MNRPSIDAQLRSYFAMVDSTQEPVDIDTITSAATSGPDDVVVTTDRGPRRRGGRTWMLVAASLAALAALAGLFVVGGSRDDEPADTPVTTPDTVAPPATTETTTADPTSTAPHAPTTTLPDDAPPPTIGQIQPPTAESPTVGSLNLVDFIGPPRDIQLSPSGQLLVELSGADVCFAPLSAEADVPAARECVDFGEPIAPGSLRWSPDETKIAFHHDVFTRNIEPDIVELDVATGQLNVVTDDGIDGQDTGETDVAPFYGTDGVLRFFRLEPTGGFRGATSARLFEADGTDVAATDIVIDGVAFLARPAPTSSNVVIGLATPEQPGGALTVIDLDEATNSPLDVPAALGLGSRSGIIDVSGGRLLTVVAPPTDGGAPAVVIADMTQPRPSSLVPINTADETRNVTGLGLSPDGTEIAMIIEDTDDPTGHQLVIASVGDDGAIGQPVAIATGPDFAPNDGDTTIRPSGLGADLTIHWIDDRLIYAVGPNQIATATITTP